MKKIALILFAQACVFVSFAQNASQALYDLFPALPAGMSNEEIVRLKDGKNPIDKSYFEVLKINGYNVEAFPVGKFVSGKTIHLLYANVSYYMGDKNDYLITFTMASFNQKSGEMVVAGLQHYLAMSGQDAQKRSSNYSLSGDLITFTIISTDKKGITEKETTTYKLGKYLEFVGRQ